MQQEITTLPTLPHSATRPIDGPPGLPAVRQARLLPGLALTLVLAGVALALGHWPWLQNHGISALTVAILLGIVLGNSVPPQVFASSSHGVAFSKQTLLRAGIILYGLRLTFQDVANVGIAGVVIDAAMLSSTFGLSWWLGTRLLGLDRRTAMLIGAGSAICGAAAVLAAEPVVQGRNEQVTVAVSTVVVFGTIAIFLYPALYHANAAWNYFPLTAHDYGVFVGSTVHEVAQVVAAGRAISEEAANTAVIAKMVRVMMLAPFLVILSTWLARHPLPAAESAAELQHATRVLSHPIAIPWFAMGFVIVAGINSLNVVPARWGALLTSLDTLLLAMAMAALGLTTHLSALREAGIRPLALAAMLFAWLVAGGVLLNTLVTRLFS